MPDGTAGGVPGQFDRVVAPMSPGALRSILRRSNVRSGEATEAGNCKLLARVGRCAVKGMLILAGAKPVR